MTKRGCSNTEGKVAAEENRHRLADSLAAQPIPEAHPVELIDLKVEPELWNVFANRSASLDDDAIRIILQFLVQPEQLEKLARGTFQVRQMSTADRESVVHSAITGLAMARFAHYDPALGKLLDYVRGHVRKLSRREGHDLRGLNTVSLDVESVKDPAANAEEVLVDIVATTKGLDCFSKLPSRDQQILRNEANDVSDEATAEALGITTGHLRVIRHRARKRLNKCRESDVPSNKSVG